MYNTDIYNDETDLNQQTDPPVMMKDELDSKGWNDLSQVNFIYYIIK